MGPIYLIKKWKNKKLHVQKISITVFFVFFVFLSTLAFLNFLPYFALLAFLAFSEYTSSLNFSGFLFFSPLSTLAFIWAFSLEDIFRLIRLIQFAAKLAAQITAWQTVWLTAFKALRYSYENDYDTWQVLKISIFQKSKVSLK